MTIEIYLMVFAYVVYTGIILLGTISSFHGVCFNPIKNYNKWTKFNWFGITVITLVINIIFLPYAICYWFYKLFTVGRKEK